MCVFFFQAEDGIRDDLVTGVQTCALPIWRVLRITPRARAKAIVWEVFLNMLFRRSGGEATPDRLEPAAIFELGFLAQQWVPATHAVRRRIAESCNRACSVAPHQAFRWGLSHLLVWGQHRWSDVFRVPHSREQLRAFLAFRHEFPPLEALRRMPSSSPLVQCWAAWCSVATRLTANDYYLLAFCPVSSRWVHANLRAWLNVPLASMLMRQPHIVWCGALLDHASRGPVDLVLGRSWSRKPEIDLRVCRKDVRGLRKVLQDIRHATHAQFQIGQYSVWAASPSWACHLHFTVHAQPCVGPLFAHVLPGEVGGLFFDGRQTYKYVETLHADSSVPAPRVALIELSDLKSWRRARFSFHRAFERWIPGVCSKPLPPRSMSSVVVVGPMRYAFVGPARVCLTQRLVVLDLAEDAFLRRRLDCLKHLWPEHLRPTRELPVVWDDRTHWTAPHAPPHNGFPLYRVHS